MSRDLSHLRLQAESDPEALVARAPALVLEAIQQAILVAHPEQEEINRTLFAGRPLAQQLAMQAEGERLGAATWRAFAERDGRPDSRDVLLACAVLEEQSAAVVEALLRDG